MMVQLKQMINSRLILIIKNNKETIKEMIKQMQKLMKLKMLMRNQVMMKALIRLLIVQSNLQMPKQEMEK